jgi:hypothetical protein
LERRVNSLGGRLEIHAVDDVAYRKHSVCTDAPTEREMGGVIS